jgi:hypothetical protein
MASCWEVVFFSTGYFVVFSMIPVEKLAIREVVWGG